GKYTSQGQSLESFVRANNLSLDGSIKTKISAAITALGNITVPFGQAIFTQQTQVINAQNAIRELKEVLENDLANLVSQKIQ
ncbi:MAG TPA: imelysin family protein, partial [Bacteroidia bacterium]|nr:imelysin family protein [Bacteroidia bacterium]